jgi:ATP-binding cassette subfamily B multidrug efflux pump
MSGQRERQPSTQPEGRGSIGDYRSAEGRGPIKGRGPVSGPGPTGRRGPMRNYGPMGIGRTVRKAKDFKGTLKRLLKYLKPHRARLAVVLIFAAASTVFSIAAPKIMSRAMNSLQESYMADTMLKELAKAQRAAVDAVNRHLAAGASGQDGLEGWMPGPSAGDMENIREPDMGLIREFLELPMLDTITDADMKADVCMRLIALGGRLQEMMPASPENAGNVGDAVKYTDEQVENVINAIRRTNGEYDFKYIGGIILVLIGLYLLSALFNLTMGLVMSGVAQNTVRDLRREVDRKLSRLPLRYYDMNPHGDILSRMTNDVDAIAGTLQQSLTQVITSVITIIGYIIMMLSISPLLTLIVLTAIPLYVLTTTIIAKKSQRYFSAQQEKLGALSGHVEEMYSGFRIVKAFGRERKSISTFDEINTELTGASRRAQFVSGIMFPLMNFISNLAYVGISVIGGIWITETILGIGDIIAFIQYSRSFTQPITQTANMANIIQNTVACAERVFEMLDEKEEIPDRSDAVSIEAPAGEVRFENVDFRYIEDVPLIENLDLHVKAGQMIAIVGPTGAGKTTLVNLLMRFYEIDAGRISVDGADTRDIRRSELRRIFGMVLQDTWLFNGTIRENIAYGKEGATDEEIVRAAKATHVDHFIRTLPDGYDTVLNEEASNISQGQKQLLTIARAILADPAILILDEATSNVDTRTELLIQRAMKNLMKSRTSFVIAHRLSTVRNAELILVMNDGKIVEIGSHRELLAKGGFYADIYYSQFAGAYLNGGYSRYAGLI